MAPVAEYPDILSIRAATPNSFITRSVVTMLASAEQLALNVVNQIPAMVAYWDKRQICLFSNEAYRDWFGRSPEEMKGMHMRELLGPLYELNLPYILAALDGKKQVFERRIPLPDGSIRESIATYMPDIVDGEVRGFSVQVADVTTLREREAALEQAIHDRDAALAEVRTLRNLLPICAFCKDIQDEAGDWQQLEAYIGKRSGTQFSHGLCPECAEKNYGHISSNSQP